MVLVMSGFEEQAVSASFRGNLLQVLVWDPNHPQHQVCEIERV